MKCLLLGSVWCAEAASGHCVAAFLLRECIVFTANRLITTHCSAKLLNPFKLLPAGLPFQWPLWPAINNYWNLLLIPHAP
jgi:hypothetical protein